jgi:hypothetical protein
MSGFTTGVVGVAAGAADCGDNEEISGLVTGCGTAGAD